MIYETAVAGYEESRLYKRFQNETRNKKALFQKAEFFENVGGLAAWIHFRQNFHPPRHIETSWKVEEMTTLARILDAFQRLRARDVGHIGVAVSGCAPSMALCYLLGQHVGFDKITAFTVTQTSSENQVEPIKRSLEALGIIGSRSIG
ncbi:hypothetical protein HDU97_010435 [Phlyctochytrium planicorne]|nr:hypothetical protein HDU97_010435 [Phlyctochytrium planicorne]